MEYANTPTPALYNQRLKLQAEYDLSTAKIEKQLLHSKQHYFEMGDKAGKLLAHQTRARALSRLIPRIESPSGNVVTDPKMVNDVFLSYYSDLYSSDCPPEVWRGRNPLESIPFPKISEDIPNNLGAPISTTEVQEAIKLLQNGKSPGPDGFIVEFYKTYSNLVSPLLTKVYNESFTKGRLPPTLSEATICLLLKKDKDPLLCNNYRPISLLNVDQKFLAKVLSTRLQKALPSLISADQTGFMAGRNSSFNTRRLLNIISSPNHDTPEAILSLDAEQAFDRVEWKYLYYILGRFGFSSDFIAWIDCFHSH